MLGGTFPFLLAYLHLWKGDAQKVEYIRLPKNVFGASHKHHDQQNYHEHGDGDWCGTQPLTLTEERIQSLRLQAFRNYTSSHRQHAQDHKDDNTIRNRRLLPTSCDELCDQCIDIQVRLNLLVMETAQGPIVPHPSRTMDLLFSGATVAVSDFSTNEEIAELFEDNLSIVNDSYQGTPFRFSWDGNINFAIGDVTFNAFEYRDTISAAIGSGDLRILDVFVAYNAHALPDVTVFGVATMGSAQTEGTGDGVYVRYDVLAGGGAPENRDLGYTLVHEIGVSVSLTPKQKISFLKENRWLLTFLDSTALA